MSVCTDYRLRRQEQPEKGILVAPVSILVAKPKVAYIYKKALYLPLLGSSLFPRKVKTKYYLHTPIASINEIGVAEAINIVTSIAFLIAFAILKIQPVNDIAYFPKWYLKGLRTSSIQTGGFGSKFINLDFMSYV
ncbi:hypothetical protein Bca4012_043486 [Brassica carinata]|uniref:(rape) hypothetical protein n=1 Tax=Brassica napus TaxID=3708 RepID=A0A816IY25_BRANA|nr:unnamed protein product [Brassica napus]